MYIYMYIYIYICTRHVVCIRHVHDQLSEVLLTKGDT